MLFTINNIRYAFWRIRLIVSDYVCMCLVLFVVSKILDSSELLSCLLEMGVEYYLVCVREGLLCRKGVEPPRGRGRLSGARESQLFFRDREWSVVSSIPSTNFSVSLRRSSGIWNFLLFYIVRSCRRDRRADLPCTLHAVCMMPQERACEASKNNKTKKR